MSVSNFHETLALLKDPLLRDEQTCAGDSSDTSRLVEECFGWASIAGKVLVLSSLLGILADEKTAW